MLTVLTLSAVLAALVLQPLVLRRWPTLDRYGLPPSARRLAREPLPWDIPLPATPPEPEPVAAVSIASPPSWIAEVAARRRREHEIKLAALREANEAAAQRVTVMREANDALEQSLHEGAAALSAYVRQQTNQQEVGVYGVSQYASAVYSEPTTPAPIGSQFDPARNCYRFDGGRVEIDAAYWANLTAGERAQFDAGSGYTTGALTTTWGS